MLAVAFTFLAYAVTGCRYFPEATFNLAPGSRLPKWVALPQGYTRADVSLTMSYYIKPWSIDATFTLQNAKGQTITTTDGKVRCDEPFQLQNSSDYPSYEVVTVHGVTEIIEHKKMEPIFYITDDPAVWHNTLLLDVSSPHLALTTVLFARPCS